VLDNRIAVTESGVALPAVAPLPAEAAIDLGFHSTMATGTENPYHRLPHVFELIVDAVAKGHSALTLSRETGVSYLPAAGEGVLASVRWDLPAADPTALRAAVDYPLFGFTKAEEAKAQAQREAERRYDGRMLRNELEERIEPQFFGAHHRHGAAVALAANALEKSAKPARKLAGEDVALAEYVDQISRHLPPEDLLYQLETMLDVPAQSDFVGAYLRKQARYTPSHLKPYVGEIQRLLDDPRISDGGPAGRFREARRQAATARNTVRSYLRALVASHP